MITAASDRLLGDRCRRCEPICDHVAVTDGSKRAIIAALLANAGIALAKFVGFLITGSAGLLAEGVHSVADTSNQGLLLLGGRRAPNGPPTASIPSGTAASATSGHSSSP